MPDGSHKISGETCACLKHKQIQETYAGRTIFVDEIQADHVAAIGEVIRFCLENGRFATKFVLAGKDAKTEQLLSAVLMGLVTDVELPPIQILEHFKDSRPSMLAQSPLHEETSH
ncbi:MAG: hypothetical protein V7703_02815, partial [Hyphomicrobiales bacterium]